ncbi:uncharacterized protein Dvar_52810 [Desulfosarcina variabilis str. Montpellier]|uniref:hypothetical protein n=1 Tax=Desulfosarcina variabilis TaxID=2300 RepID=UPI003AFA99D9
MLSDNTTFLSAGLIFFSAPVSAASLGGVDIHGYISQGYIYSDEYKVTLDWAYGDYRWKDWLGIRAGRLKLPVGLYNDIRDMDMLRTNIVMPQGIYRDLLRETSNAANGGGLYGNVYLGQ